MIARKPTKEVLLYCKDFNRAYRDLKQKVQDTDFWYVDSLEYFAPDIPVKAYRDICANYGTLLLVFAELQEPTAYPDFGVYGFIVTEREEL